MTVTGRGPDGLSIERTVFLAFEAQPGEGVPPGVWLAVGVGMVALAALGLILRRRRRGPGRSNG